MSASQSESPHQDYSVNGGLPKTKVDLVPSPPFETPSASPGDGRETVLASSQQANEEEARGPFPMIPGHTIVRKLGGGGMGVVYEAVNRLGKTVALKVVRPDRANDEFRARFRLEAAALQELDHPNLARIFEYNEANGVPFFTMRLLTGGTLAAQKTGFQSDPPKTIHLLTTIADAVGFLHKRGLLHRDLKPSNIFFDDQGQPFISDFGLVKMFGAEATNAERPALAPVEYVTDSGGVEITSAGDIIGTPRYMAPELLAGQFENICPASDVFALGLILFELLAGKRPFEGEDRASLRLSIENGGPPRLRLLNPLVDADIENIVLKCLAKDPKQRFATANDLARALHQWTAKQEADRTRRRWRKRIAIAAASMLLLTLAAVPIVQHFNNPDRPLHNAQSALLRGKSVELIPVQGMPIHFRSLTGDEANIFLETDGTMTVSTLKTVLLELLPDPMCEHYKFKVSVRQNLSASLTSRAGIYFLHSAHEQNDEAYHWFFELSVIEDDDYATNLWREAKKLRPNHTITSVGCFLRRFNEAPLSNYNKQHKSREIESEVQKVRASQWHDLEVEVSSNGVVAKYNGKQLDYVKYSTMQTGLKISRAAGTKGPFDPPLSPRGGLGLYNLGSSASYRLGVIEPIAQPKS